MIFSWTDEQRLIQSSALDWLDHHYDFRQREKSLHCEGGNSAVWASFSEMGWLGLGLSEEVGGFPCGLMEKGLLMHALGRHLVVEPFLSCIVQAARLLDLAGTPDQRQLWLPSVVAGQKRLALLHHEKGDALPWGPPRCSAKVTDTGWLLNGLKTAVIGSAGASQWLVTATSSDNQFLLLLVDPNQAGVKIDAYPTSDGRHAADIYFEQVTVKHDALLGGSDGRFALNRVVTEGVIAACWEATGAMEAAFEQTKLYTQQRKQFGQSIANFQVVQHRLAEMAVQCTEAQAACELATLRLDKEDIMLAPQVAAGVKNKVGRAARFVAQECVQLHGAMGVCEELPIASTFRMLTTFAQVGGHADSHAQWLGRELSRTGSYAHSQTLGAF